MQWTSHVKTCGFALLVTGVLFVGSEARADGLIPPMPIAVHPPYAPASVVAYQPVVVAPVVPTYGPYYVPGPIPAFASERFRVGILGGVRHSVHFHTPYGPDYYYCARFGWLGPRVYERVGW